MTACPGPDPGEPRFRTARRFRSRPRKPPPPSATPPRPRHATIRCRSSSRGIPGTEPDGGTNVVSEQLERRAFLDGALHAEPWRGLAFGVFRNRNRGYNDPDLNFFGLTLPVGLPTVETVHGGTWSVRADIGDCPDLELVLPARKEAVENDFLKAMRNAARLAIYRALAASPDPRPAFDDWKLAREAGIDIAPPPAVLRPWRPATADVDDWREPPKLAVPGHGALVMDVDPEPPEAQAFCRAAEAGRNGDEPLRDRPPACGLRLV